MAEAAVQWFEDEIRVWRPPEKMSISEWAEDRIVLTRPFCDEPGPFRIKRIPFFGPVMDIALDPIVRVIVLCKPAQIAGTQCWLCIVGYYSEQEPTSIMVVMADEDTAKHISENRIHTMFQNSEKLSDLIIPGKMNQDQITLRNRTYIGMGWASSVSKVASRPMQIAIEDEIDKPGYNLVTREAKATSLIDERTKAFSDTKIFRTSTPTDEKGNIWQELNSCDVIFDWHVPCPYCGQYQPLRWSREHCTDLKDGVYRDENGKMQPLGQVTWEGGHEATPEQLAKAGYACGSCGAVWNNIQKNRAVELGRMVPRAEFTRVPKKVGFHINRIYSLLADAGDISVLVEAFIAAKKSDDPLDLQGFINSTLAEPWRQVIVTSTESVILQARTDLPPQTVPPEAVALTCGVDGQKYGFYFVVRAWARDFTSWLIHYGYIPTWADVETIAFDTRYPIRDSEHFMPIWRTAIDTGGTDLEEGLSMTEECYFWLRQNMGRGFIWGTKGASTPLAGKIHMGKALDKTPSGKPLPGGLQLILLDTHKLKDLYHYRLKKAVEGEPHGAYLHAEVGEDYAKQILAEQKERDKRGKEGWVRKHRDNHYLDCEVGCMALADPEWPTGGVNLFRQDRRPGPRPEPAPAKRKGGGGFLRPRNDWFKGYIK